MSDHCLSCKHIKHIDYNPYHYCELAKNLKDERLRAKFFTFGGCPDFKEQITIEEELAKLRAINAKLVEALEDALKTAQFESHHDRPWHYAACSVLAEAKAVQS